MYLTAFFNQDDAIIFTAISLIIKIKFIFAVKFDQMRFWVSIITLSLFLSSLIRPILPVYEYLLNYNYIANVLCVNKDKPEMHCNGKCYLMKKLSKSANPLNSPKNESSTFRYKPFPVYFERIDELIANFFVVKLRDRIFSKSNSLESLEFKPQVPPPQL